MKRKNKKGFTLIELLAVIIVLIIIILIAYNIIKRNIDKTMDNAVIANAGSYVKAVNSYVGVESIENSSLVSGIFTVEGLEGKVSVSGTKPDSGSLLVINRKVKKACLEYDGYYVVYEDSNVSNPSKEACSLSYEEKFTSSDQEIFEVPITGKYRIEIWGAGLTTISGGSSYGYYAVGDIDLQSEDELSITTGQSGEWKQCAVENGTCSLTGTHTVCMGTGTSWSCKTITDSTACHINVFGDAAPNRSKVCKYFDGVANASTTSVSMVDQFNHKSLVISGSDTSADISNDGLTNKHITCYNCTQSTSPYVINSTTCTNSDPKEDCSKVGSGYVKISFIE